MAGMISVGEEYKGKAMSGFIREAADQQRINQENKDAEAQQKAQHATTATTSVSAAVSIGLMLAKFGPAAAVAVV